MNLILTIHRGTQQIGGSCIEIAHPDGSRLILDAGRPLDAPDGATNLLPLTLDRQKPATVLISHPHQDHWGLVHELPAKWPVWTGSGSAKLIAVTLDITRRPLQRKFETWTSRTKTFEIGPFSIKPILTDHSAYDAYMLLIEAAGKRILYTGDFRRHGRKSALVDKLMNDPPKSIDVLITEGTNLGTNKPVQSEHDLESELIELFKRTQGRVFVSWSGQNIDRTVTLFRAAKRTGRDLVIDLYTADILDRISAGSRLPRAGIPNLKIVITGGLSRNYKRQGREDFVERMVKHGTSAKRVAKNSVIMLRRALIKDYASAGLLPTKDDAFNFSMWRGYLDQAYYTEPLEWCQSAGAEIAHIHSSGHASSVDLIAFATAVNSKIVVPVHGANWDTESAGFANLRRLDDGETMEV